MVKDYCLQGLSLPNLFFVSFVKSCGMDKKTVRDLIRSKETFRIEKTISTTDTEKFCQAICAFSNDLPRSGKPGYLLIGVKDYGTLSGMKATDELLRLFAGLRID